MSIRFFFIFGLFLCVASALLLAGCFSDLGMKSARVDDGLRGVMPSSVTGSVSLDAYLLGPGDEIQILVFGEESLSAGYVLDGRGVVALPLIAEVNLGGMTAAEAAKEIIARYSDGYLQNPDITLRVTRYRPYFVLGEIRSPGRYDYQENLTILEAIAAAQGFTYRANQDEIELLRKVGPQAGRIRANTQTTILPGDIIRVNERFF